MGKGAKTLTATDSRHYMPTTAAAVRIVPPSRANTPTAAIFTALAVFHVYGPTPHREMTTSCYAFLSSA